MSDPEPTNSEPAAVPTTQSATSEDWSTPLHKLLLGIGLLLWITNPSMETHAKAIGAAYRKEHPFLTTFVLNPEPWAKAGGTHFSYLVFSVVSATDGGKTWSIGALGMVYVFDAAV